MNRKTSICLNNLLSQYPPRKSKVEMNFDSPRITQEQSCTYQLQQIKKKNFQKLLTSDFSNSLDKIEFTNEKEQKKREEKKVGSLKDAVKLIQEQYNQSFSQLNYQEKQEVPEFIRQRDLQKREMQKIISQNNIQIQVASSKKSYQLYVIEFILMISIFYMWVKIIQNFWAK